MTHTCLSSGGMVLNPSYFGTVGHHNTMIHEMGHILGLYHVFKGVSERDSCDDPCQVGLLNLLHIDVTFWVSRYVFLFLLFFTKLFCIYFFFLDVFMKSLLFCIIYFMLLYVSFFSHYVYACNVLPEPEVVTLLGSFASSSVMCICRRPPRPWRQEICVPTLHQRQNPKPATIPGTSAIPVESPRTRTPLIAITWVTQVQWINNLYLPYL